MPELDFNKSIEALLRDKISYHKEQAKYHARMAVDAKKKLDVLSGIDVSITETADAQDTSDAIVTNNGNGSTNTDNNLSVTIWKPKVEKVLSNSDRPLKTHEILSLIDNSYLADEDLRKKAIAVISSSLYSLVENKKAQKHEAEGRGYAYSKV